MPEISVIIPTRNRADSLKDALESVLNQSLAQSIYEVIVVDNGSTDGTNKVVEQLHHIHGDRIRYLYDPTPGLHVGRHLGAREAASDILVYADDDILAFPEWLEGVKSAFAEPGVALVGGKNLPRWEAKVPDWVFLFQSAIDLGWYIGYLSLLDFGDMRREIPANYVFGCNFSIRRHALYECGGFHPDSMPQELIRYRGDGETALSRALMERGFRTVYEPRASVFHRVPAERLTVEYFCRRAYNQGVSDSYTEIRRNKGLRVPGRGIKLGPSLVKRAMSKALSVLRDMVPSNRTGANPVVARVRQSYQEGWRYHWEQVASDPELLAFVLRENYFSNDGPGDLRAGPYQATGREAGID